MKTVLATLALFLSTVVTAGAADVENPEYKNWSSFKPGSWVKFKMTTEAGANKTEMEQTVKLLEVTPTKAVVETTMITGSTRLPAQKREVPAKLATDPKATTTAVKGTKPAEGSEDLTVGGKKVKAQWVESTIESGTNKTTAKIWQSKSVPGGTVKMESTTSGAVASKTSMVATEWKE